MRRRARAAIAGAAAAFLAATAAPVCRAQASEPELSAAHDGRWAVNLSCPDFRDKSGLVKGYDYAFRVTVAGGQLEGRHDVQRSPAFVHFAGRVLADGTLSIRADGNTGPSEFTVGHVRPGTPYVYTLKGSLGTTSGKAERVELRPCTATFTRAAE